MAPPRIRTTPLTPMILAKISKPPIMTGADNESAKQATPKSAPIKIPEPDKRLPWAALTQR